MRTRPLRKDEYGLSGLEEFMMLSGGLAGDALAGGQVTGSNTRKHPNNIKGARSKFSKTMKWEIRT